MQKYERVSKTNANTVIKLRLKRAYHRKRRLLKHEFRVLFLPSQATLLRIGRRLCRPAPYPLTAAVSHNRPAGFYTGRPTAAQLRSHDARSAPTGADRQMRSCSPTPTASTLRIHSPRTTAAVSSLSESIRCCRADGGEQTDALRAGKPQCDRTTAHIRYAVGSFRMHPYRFYTYRLLREHKTIKLITFAPQFKRACFAAPVACCMMRPETQKHITNDDFTRDSQGIP